MLLAAAGYTMDAAGMQAFANNYSDATTLLEGSQPTSQDELDEKNMMRLYFSMIQENDPKYVITSHQLESVNALAQGINPASTQARNVLHLLDQTIPVPEIPDYYRGLVAARLPSPKDRFIVTNYYTFDEVMLAVNPNPAGAKTMVSYQFASSVTKPLMRICDANGRQRSLKSINQYSNSQLLETFSLAPGVYYVQLMDGSSLLKSVPLVIIK
jgi:hypothetical protein